MSGVRGANKKLRPSFLCECGAHAFSNTSRWGVAIVSPGDAWLLREYCWTLVWPQKTPSIAYAASTRYSKDVGDTTICYLHRIIFGEVGADHIDGHGLNCQRSNLRQSTQAQNMRNRRCNIKNKTGLKGVSLTREGKYRARLTHENEEIWLGHFDTPEAAGLAYDAEAMRRFGTLARLNFPEGSHENN